MPHITLFEVARLAVRPHAVLPNLRYSEAILQLQGIDLQYRLGVLVEEGKQCDGEEKRGGENNKAGSGALLFLSMNGEGERHNQVWCVPQIRHTKLQTARFRGRSTRRENLSDSHGTDISQRAFLSASF
jgi:hypothetical protein